MTNIGYDYQIGRGVPKDLYQAFAWYSKAANAGNVVAMYIWAHVSRAVTA